MEEARVVPDVDFVNLLIKKRQLRRDYLAAKVRQSLSDWIQNLKAGLFRVALNCFKSITYSQTS